MIATLLFGVVVARTAYIQFEKGEEYSQAAYAQQVKDKLISPNRGTIYSSNGDILAQSVSVDTVSLNPGMVKYSNGKNVSNEIIAEGISTIFDVTYEEMLKKLNSGSSVVVIEKKVETDKIEKLKAWMTEKNITAGINIDEDSKRNYPNGNLASNLVGFCGSDNVGLTGIEERWNDVLTGTAGKVVTATDVNDQAISDEDELYIATENGSNIYLTIDTKIQAIAEKYLEKAVKENKCADGGNVIIMNPQNGNILAMATYPDYDLNNPRSYINFDLSETEWNNMSSEDKSDALYELWKNKAVSGSYEPGSTFKLIIAAAGLEEGVVKTDTAGDFYCGGVYHVGDRDISCWRSYNPHLSQTLRKALQNSCNPAFMQLGKRIGATTLYKYLNAFGFFDKIGSNIAKAYAGQFTDISKVGEVELATTSFGQRFTISPLQLITAVSAICNDGVLVEPRIVEKVENTDTKSVQVTEVNEVRQVISKTTADKVKDMMLSVVEEGTGKLAKVAGYSIGGKSGTSEPRENHEDDGYVASFISISPIENTQVVALVVLYDPKGDSHQGGQTAGPVASEIMAEVLPYLGIQSTNSSTSSSKYDNLLSVPNLVNKTVSEARKTLETYGFEVNVSLPEGANEEEILVTEQNPKAGTSLLKNSVVCLKTTENDTKKMVKVPNVKELTVEKAQSALNDVNLNISVSGTTGIIVSQNPTYGTEVEEGAVIEVVIKEKLIDGQ